MELIIIGIALLIGVAWWMYTNHEKVEEVVEDVEDAIDATIHCVSKCNLKETINIGSNEELTSLEVSNIIGSALGFYAINYELVEGRKGSAKRRVPNISKLLEYYPEYSPIKLQNQEIYIFLQYRELRQFFFQYFDFLKLMQFS